MNRSRIRNAATAVAACATVAAMVGIATGAAAPSDNERENRSAKLLSAPLGPPPGTAMRRFRGGPAGGIGLGGPPVHSEMVVPNRSGDGFVTITQDSGEVDSVSGDRLTITEGTDEATYKTVTIDIPGDARVVRNGEKAELSELQKGDHAHVSESSQNSFVFAIDNGYQKQMDKRMRQMRKSFRSGNEVAPGDLPRPPAGTGPPVGPPPIGMPPRRGN